VIDKAGIESSSTAATRFHTREHDDRQAKAQDRDRHLWHTQGIKTGKVPIKGWIPTSSRSCRSSERSAAWCATSNFDVCEMAPTTYMIARALGAPFIALPVFIMRRFHHGGFVVRPDSGSRRRRILEGKKVGVRAYSVTTGVWTRGIFVNEYGPRFLQGHLGGRTTRSTSRPSGCPPMWCTRPRENPSPA